MHTRGPKPHLVSLRALPETGLSWSLSSGMTILSFVLVCLGLFGGHEMTEPICK